MNIGMIGCGNISSLYLKTIQHFAQLQVVALSDLDTSLAKQRADEFGIAQVLTTEEMLGRPDIDLILNLTVPAAHAEIARQSLTAGKHVYNEKPLSAELHDAHELVQLAQQLGLRLGCAPSTFLGATVQTARKVIDDGLIGTPVAANALMMSHGMEHWHPNPVFFYQPGAGPMFDIGPYYLTALITLLGGVESVTAQARISFPERSIGTGANAGKTFPVTTPTHISGVMQHSTGVLSTVVTSFDVWHTETPKFEVHGSEGSLSLEAPNIFGGKVRLRQHSDDTWQDVPLIHDYTSMERGWGLGLADMADALAGNRPHQASGEQALHVLELMHAFLQSAEQGKRVSIQSQYQRPEGFTFDK